MISPPNQIRIYIPDDYSTILSLKISHTFKDPPSINDSDFYVSDRIMPTSRINLKIKIWSSDKKYKLCKNDPAYLQQIICGQIYEIFLPNLPRSRINPR
ncbi:hypothetical protein NQ317_011584 [Molorchus minor]|uniref:Uncharacterized protein n=1 Tax=Molorchus minor TaxID=1323400 RepID=A0ABQ9J3I2_9CUCU|nr:hypothetical protein NQ317_011584 [Molorchus minor]